MSWSDFWLACGIGLLLVDLALGFIYLVIWLKCEWDHYWWRKHYKPIQNIIPKKYANEIVGWGQEVAEMRKLK